MLKPFRTVTMSVTVSLATVSGCLADPVDRPPILEASKHLVLRAPLDLEVCGGTFSMMESEVIRIRALFGEVAGPVDYAWMPWSHYPRDDFPCSTTNAGCAIGSDVYDRLIAHTHEVVHAARGHLPAPFEEGLATVLSASDRTTDALAPREELHEALTASSWSYPGGFHLYERAAHFVSFLIAAEGMDTFVKFERRFQTVDTYNAPFEQWVLALEDIYDAPFNEIWAFYETYPDCPPAQFHLPLTACAALAEQTPEATLIPALLGEPGPDASFTRSFTCEQDDIVGPVFVGSKFTRTSTHVVELASTVAAGSVGVALVGEVGEGSRALLTNCGNCWSGSAAYVTSTAPTELAQLEPGPHALVLDQAIDELGPIGIELE